MQLFVEITVTKELDGMKKLNKIQLFVEVTMTKELDEMKKLEQYYHCKSKSRITLLLFINILYLRERKTCN